MGWIAGFGVYYCLYCNSMVDYIIYGHDKSYGKKGWKGKNIYGFGYISCGDLNTMLGLGVGGFRYG